SVNGTAHTAGFRDLRLARKVVSVMRMQRDVLADRRPSLEARERLRSELGAFLASGNSFDAAWLLRFLRAVGGPEVEALISSLRARTYTVEVIPDADFDEAIGLKGKTGFFEMRREGPQRLLIRGLPSNDAPIPALLDRILTAVHEWQHAIDGAGEGSRQN